MTQPNNDARGWDQVEGGARLASEWDATTDPLPAASAGPYRVGIDKAGHLTSARSCSSWRTAIAWAAQIAEQEFATFHEPGVRIDGFDVVPIPLPTTPRVRFWSVRARRAGGGFTSCLVEELPR